MRVRRVTGWARSGDLGGFVLAGEVVEMDDALAAIHIRNGDAEAIGVAPTTDAGEPDPGAPSDGDGDTKALPTLDDVAALRRKADAVEMAKALGVEVDKGDSLEDMKAALALALEPTDAGEPDPGAPSEET